jgi:hypothetical protein
MASWAFYPAVGAVVLGLAGLLFYRNAKAKKNGSIVAEVPTVAAAARRKPAKAAAIHSCNVLQPVGDQNQLWQFDARGESFVLGREQVAPAQMPMPARLVARDWRSLFRRRLNVACLRPEDVFLRVTHLPRSDFDETLSMVELQLEKLSPMPVAQVVWSFHVLPQAKGDLQTVLVMIVARSVVEEFLGRLEGEGYLADRLELPLVDQLQATAVSDDGAWIYPESGVGSTRALVAWWYGGVLQNLDLLMLPPANRPAGVKEQLMQMAWAGELEGWLAGPPSWYLVADEVTALEWEPVLRSGLDAPVRTVAPMGGRELAALTARRAAQSNPAVSLLPFEYLNRYQQQFVDRLWMRLVGVVLGVYVIGVAIYLVALGFVSHQAQAVEDRVTELGQSYTNAIVLRDKAAVLREREDLKYAALECWNAAATLMTNENITLDSLDFADGQRFRLNGTAPATMAQELLNFEAAMHKYTLLGKPLFSPEGGESLQYRGNPGGGSMSWNFSLLLKRKEVQ